MLNQVGPDTKDEEMMIVSKYDAAAELLCILRSISTI